jgi:hypothetical protein
VRLFLSYHTPEAETAKRIAELLESARPGLTIFFAPRELAAGGYWIPKLAEELKRSDAFLFLAGNRVGPWQEIEYYEAQRLARSQPSGKALQIIPLVIGLQAPGLPFFELLHQIHAKNATTSDMIGAVLKALDGVPERDDTPAWARFNPYKGLPSFTSSDSAYFFGREQLTADILDELTRHPNRVLALVGKSGVGKSSIAQAGVVAALRSQIWPMAGLAWPEALSDSRNWAPMVLRPEDQPLKELARQFLRLAMPSPADQEVEAGKWAKAFADPAEVGEASRFDGLVRAVKAMLAERGLPAPKRFFLYVDQAEEIYSRNTDEIAARFTQLLAEAAGRIDCQVILSLRSDYYGDLQSDQALFALLSGSDARRTLTIDIAPLDKTVLCAVIQRPAAQFGVRFRPESLPEIIATSASREAGSLPLLSYLLSDMWTAMQARGDGVLRWDESPELFEIAAPLRERAERYLREHPDMTDAVKRLFTLRLALLPREGDAIKRRARAAECSDVEWRNAEMLAGQDWRLVTLGSEAGEATAEVAHEQLLRKWNRLIDWLEERRAFLAWKAEVEAARSDYEATPNGERPAALLSGRALLIARQWYQASTNTDDIAPTDRAYIEASVARHDELERVARESDLARARDREANARKLARRTMLGMIGTSALACAAGGAAIWAFHAEEQFREEQQKRLAAEQKAAQLASLAESMRTDLAGQLLAFAASPGQLAQDGTGPNSPYTEALVRALQQRDSSFNDALFRTNEEVLQATRGAQRPFLSSDMNGQIFLWRGPPNRRISALVVSSDRWGDNVLPNADNDAQSWVQLFRSANINVERMQNPGRAHLLDALDSQASALAPKHGNLLSGLVHKVGLARIESPERNNPNTLSIFIFVGMGGIQINGENLLPLWEDFQQFTAAFDSDAMEKAFRERSIPIAEISTRLRTMAAASIFVFDSNFLSYVRTSTR